MSERLSIPVPGKRMGGYELKKQLFSSLLGTLFHAVSREGQSCLLYFFPPKLLKYETHFVSRFQEKLEHYKKVDKKYVMVPEALIQIDSYWVIRYNSEVEKTLTTFVHDRTIPLQEEETKKILSDVSKGLRSAAGRNLYHYFLTPDFILECPDGTFKVIGLGIFQSIDYEGFEQYISAAISPIAQGDSQRFSALEILSPELRDLRKADQRTDFFCIGMCTYYMLTGKKPVRNWELPSQVRGELNEGWDLLVSNCLEPLPKDRFPSYNVFLNDLANVHELAAKPMRESGRLLRILEIVPLPQNISKRLDSRSLAILKIFLSLVFVGGTIGLATLFLLILFGGGEEGEVYKASVRQVDPEDASIIINFNTPSVRVKVINEGGGTFITSNGKLFLDSLEPSLKLLVSSPGYQNSFYTIDVMKSGPAQIESISLTPDFLELNFYGLPGADVFLLKDGGEKEKLGVMNSEGKLFIPDVVTIGNHSFVVTAIDHKPWQSERIDFSRGTYVVLPDLEAQAGEVYVTSVFNNVEVYLDGEKQGTAPLLLDEVKPNRATRLTVTRNGYRDQYMDIFLDPAESIEVDFSEWEIQIGGLELNLSPAELTEDPKLDILLGGKEYELDSLSRLRAGIYEMVIVHPDYHMESTTFQVVDNQIVPLDVTMAAKPARLSINIDPEANYQLRINGEQIRLNEYGDVVLLVDRESQIQLAVRDYVPLMTTFTPGANEQIVWDPPLEKIPGPVKGQGWKPPYFELEMIWVPSGMVKMGSPKEEIRRLPNEGTITHVRLNDGMWVARYEVTQGLYQRIMGSNPSTHKGDSKPVESVSWENANTFMERLNLFEKRAGRLPEGFVYRLPTEAEWEYFGRAASETAFHFGETASSVNGNFKGMYPRNSSGTGQVESGIYGTVAVGSYPPNDWGLYDVHGNVAEWVFDVYWDRLPGGVLTDFIHLGDGRGRSVRGGSWEDPAHRVRSAARLGVSVNSTRDSIGFRVVLAKEIAE